MSSSAAPAVTEKERMYVALFAEQSARGLSLTALSRETSIPTGTLSWWTKEIRRREALRRSSGEADFVPVTVRETGPSRTAAR